MRRTPADIATFHLWSLSEDVVLERSPEEAEVLLRSRWGTDRLRITAPAVYEALRRMELGPVLLDNAAPRAQRAAQGEPDPGAAPGTDMYVLMLPVLDQLSHLVVRTLGADDLTGPLLSVFPLSLGAPFTLVRLPGERRVRIPGEVALRVLASGFALESADSPYRVVLHRPEAALVVALLAWPVTAEAASRILALPPRVTAEIIGYLAAAGMATAVDEKNGQGGQSAHGSGDPVPS